MQESVARLPGMDKMSGCTSKLIVVPNPSLGMLQCLSEQKTSQIGRATCSHKTIFCRTASCPSAVTEIAFQCNASSSSCSRLLRCSCNCFGILLLSLSPQGFLHALMNLEAIDARDEWCRHQSRDKMLVCETEQMGE